MPLVITKSKNSFQQLPGPLIVALSAGGGLLLGVLARLWMRWITTNPEFTWGGTLGIVFSFTLFFAMQSLLFVVRRKKISRLKDWIFRVIAIFFTLPLFGAAGAIMFPVVLLGSLSYWRATWPKWLRTSLGVLSAAWAARVAHLFIISKFGWSLESIAQILVFIGIYLLLIRLTKGTVAYPRLSI